MTRFLSVKTFLPVEGIGVASGVSEKKFRFDYYQEDKMRPNVSSSCEGRTGSCKWCVPKIFRYDCHKEEKMLENVSSGCEGRSFKWCVSNISRYDYHQKDDVSFLLTIDASGPFFSTFEVLCTKIPEAAFQEIVRFARGG